MSATSGSPTCCCHPSHLRRKSSIQAARMLSRQAHHAVHLHRSQGATDRNASGSHAEPAVAAAGGRQGACAGSSSTHLVDIAERSKDCVVLGPPFTAVQAAGAGIAGLGVDLHAAGRVGREAGEDGQAAGRAPAAAAPSHQVAAHHALVVQSWALLTELRWRRSLRPTEPDDATLRRLRSRCTVQVSPE